MNKKSSVVKIGRRSISSRIIASLAALLGVVFICSTLFAGNETAGTAAPAPVSTAQPPSADPSNRDMNVSWNVNLIKMSPDGEMTPYPSRFGVSTRLNLVKLFDSRQSRMYIFNFDTQKFWISDYKAKSTGSGLFDQLKTAANRKAEIQSKELDAMDASLKTLSPDLRKKREAFIESEKNLKKLFESDFTAKTGAKEKVDIYQTQVVNIFSRGGKVATVWIAKDFNSPSRWQKFADLMAEIDPSRWKIIAVAGGVPIKVEFNHADMNMTWKLERLDLDNIPLSYFLLQKDNSITDFTLY